MARFYDRKRTCLVIGLLLCAGLYLPAQFAYRFEIFGLAVNHPKLGWLGPTPRGSSCVSDIGKVNTWTCSSTDIYRKHHLGSRLWLRVFGYS